MAVPHTMTMDYWLKHHIKGFDRYESIQPEGDPAKWMRVYTVIEGIESDLICVPLIGDATKRIEVIAKRHNLWIEE